MSFAHWTIYLSVNETIVNTYFHVRFFMSLSYWNFHVTSCRIFMSLSCPIFHVPCMSDISCHFHVRFFKI